MRDLIRRRLFKKIYKAPALSLAFLSTILMVLSAFFITYTIYHMAERLFKSEREIFCGTKQSK